MRVLHVVPSYIPAWRYGGPIHSVHGLCKALAARGNEVHVATTNVDGESDSQVPLGVPVCIDDVYVHYFPSRRLRRLYYSPPMRDFIRREIDGYDLVHTHSVFLWPTAAAAHEARRSGKPYLVSPRGMLVKELIEKRSAVLKRSWIALVERRNIERAAAVHVTSAAEEADLREVGLRPATVFEIPNGIDLPDGAAQPPEPEPGMPARYALFLSRISWKKGLERLLDALALAPGIELVVAGNDDENYWPAMEQKTRALGIADRVRYIGFVEGQRKGRVLAGAQLLVLPSYSENFGNVVLEAMALGVPVVVTPEVGLSATVDAAQAGRVVAGEPPLIARAMSELMSNEAERHTLGAHARAAAREFSWSRIAEQMETRYKALA